MVVLEVRILDKLAATYGPSFESMRRSGPPNQVEEETGSAIKWLGNLTGVPPSLSILAEDGSEVVATLRFEGCGSRRPNERHHPARNHDEGQGKNSQRDPATLPQGAIQGLFPDISLAPRAPWRTLCRGRVESRVRVPHQREQFTRALSVLWPAYGRNWHTAEARGKSFF